MLIRLEMELEDIPGQLIKILEPISKFGGNIQNVVHQREKKTPLGRVPVTVIFDVDERERFQRIISTLKRMGVRIIRIGERESAVKVSVLLAGHVVHAGIRDLVSRLSRIGGIRVSNLNLLMGKVGGESAAYLTLAGGDEKKIHKGLEELERIAERKKLLVIRAVGS
jgi:ACT domain-containing protein